MNGFVNEPLIYKKVKYFLAILESNGMLWSSRFVIERNACKEIPESSKWEFWKKIPANNFVLSNTGAISGNILGPLDIGGIADLSSLYSWLYSGDGSVKPWMWVFIRIRRSSQHVFEGILFSRLVESLVCSPCIC